MASRKDLLDAARDAAKTERAINQAAAKTAPTKTEKEAAMTRARIYDNIVRELDRQDQQ